MKTLALIAVCAALCGCTSTEIVSSNWALKRTSFLQRLDVAEISVSTNGIATMRGYRNDGGGEALATVTAAAVAAAINSTKP